MGQYENEEGANLRSITRNLRLAQRMAPHGELGAGPHESGSLLVR